MHLKGWGWRLVGFRALVGFNLPHGMYHWLTQGSGWHQSYQWLGRTEQRCSEHGRKEDCYKTAPETIKHIVARWKMWAGTMYTERHNQVAYSVQEHLWCIEIRSPQAPIEPIWDTTKGDDELKTGRRSVEFLPSHREAAVTNQPDIVVVEKMQKTVGLIDETTTSGRRSTRK